MDQTHEEFVELIGALTVSSDDRMALAVDAVLAHARRHFGEEDRWMTETAFPARECHANEHAAVLQSIEAVRDRVERGERFTGRRLAEALTEWLPAHLDYLDAPLAHWMCKRRLGGKPVVVRRQISTCFPPVGG